MQRRQLFFVATITVGACATLPERGGGGDNLPSATAGPFRALVQAELGNLRVAPNALDDDRFFPRDPAILDRDGDPATLEVVGYFGAAMPSGGAKPLPSDPGRAILRYGALDGRSFDSAAEVVLAPTEAWEGGVVFAPSALLVNGETWLFYAALGGIGLAKSRDGQAFTRVPGPVLAPATTGWEGAAAPTSPGVVHLPDGSLRMFYAVAVTQGVHAIGEASSSDGITWTRLGTQPALAPTPPGTGDDLAYDDASVGSPFPVLATSGDGRAILRVYYGARDRLGNEVIGLAARYLDAEPAPLQRGVAAVFGATTPLSPREPCVLAYPGFTLLFATEKAAPNSESLVVAAALSPATAALPAPFPR